MAIEAVIWDFGGVFTTSPFEAFNRYEAARGLPKDLIRTVNATNPLENAWALFERAEIDRDGFDTKFLEESTALGHPVRGADVLPLLSGDVRPRMVEALKLCKAHFKVGCITNNMAQGHGPGMSATAEGASRSAGIMALFDVIIESSKAGVRKPDPRIYQMMCEQTGRRRRAPASTSTTWGSTASRPPQLGMTAIKVVTEAQALDDLAAATGLTFPSVPPKGGARMTRPAKIGAAAALKQLPGWTAAEGPRRDQQDLQVRRLQRRPSAG